MIMPDLDSIDWISFGAGIVLMYAFMHLAARQHQRSIRKNGDQILEKAKQEADQLKSQREQEFELELERKKLEQERTFQQKENKLELEEKELEKLKSELTQERESLRQKALKLAERRRDLEEKMTEYPRKLEALASMTRDQAVEELKREAKQECQEEIEQMRNDVLGRASEEVKQDARRIMVDTLQRISTQSTSEISATVVQLPNDDMKGRIIGREGRNIHSFEAATGCTLMIDETPESVLISSFDPVRREIARQALEDLIKDGRIHPGTIEEAVRQAEEHIEQNITSIGDEAIARLKLGQSDPEITTYLGKLHFYLSNNQRTLEHCIETGFICSIMASELGLNAQIAKRAGLLHDIGKAMPQEYESSHALAGARLLKAHGEAPEVVNAVEAHHEEVSPTSPYAPLLRAADALSGSREGARQNSMENYIQRIKALEDIARQFSGVKEVYALHAGRELRVIVTPEEIDDPEARNLSLQIRKGIEQNYSFPSTIKITVIRETRYTETAT